MSTRARASKATSRASGRTTPARRPPDVAPRLKTRVAKTESYTEVLVRSWHDFVELVSSPKYDGWAFRGQQQAEWPLFSSLSRYLQQYIPESSRWPSQEARSIRIFRRKAHHFQIPDEELDDDLSCIALMQHHGSPTRLLDFTKSPFVAAFFALERATTDAAVWALNSPALYFDANLKRRGGARHTRDQVDPRNRGVFDEYYLPNRHKFVWMGEPWRMNRRLIAQSGTFLVPGVIDVPIEEILSYYRSPYDMMVKFVLPARTIRRDAMWSLYRMNITHATLFPDLDGLARSLAYELETEWRGTLGKRGESS